MKKIELKGLCSEVEITLNNLRDCRVEESNGSVTIEFGGPGMAIENTETESGGTDDEE